MSVALRGIARWVVRNVPGVRGLGRAFLKAVQTPDIEIAEIRPLSPIASPLSTPRFNLLLPSLAQEHLFGGASTALQFFEALTAECVDARIVLTDVDSLENIAIAVRHRWPSVLKPGSDQPGRCLAAVGGKASAIPLAVRSNDIFVSTIWWSAYKAKALLAWQAQHFGRTLGPLTSLIQDHEPGFYPWGSRYLLAQSSYHYAGPLHAVINSPQLADYLQAQGYQFSSTQVFEAGLHPSLRAAAHMQSQLNKERILLVYGRPGVERNAFALLVQALQLWAQRLPEAAGWQIISLGEQHANIPLAHGLCLQSLGKVSLAEYAQWLRRAAVGMSLMVSPHPSYPPLEMATFEADVITVPFANKSMTEHPRWFAVTEPTPDRLAQQLVACTQAFDAQLRLGPVLRTINLNHPWVLESDPFAFAPALAQRLMKQHSS